MSTDYPAQILNYDGTEIEVEGIVNFTDPANAPGGSQPVACVLACDAAFTIHDIGNYDILWDALYDNLWDLDPLGAIPAGLGLTFAFDGSSSLVVPTEPGIWTFSYLGTRDGDPGGLWSGAFVVGIGGNFPWLQAESNNVAVSAPLLGATLATPLPTGAQLTHQVSTVDAYSATPANVNQVYLSIVRHA